MSVHSRPSIQYQDGMELTDWKMTKDCTQPLRSGNIRALNECAGKLFGAATLHNHKNSANKSNRKAMNRNWGNSMALLDNQNVIALHLSPAIPLLSRRWGALIQMTDASSSK